MRNLMPTVLVISMFLAGVAVGHISLSEPDLTSPPEITFNVYSGVHRIREGKPIGQSYDCIVGHQGGHNLGFACHPIFPPAEEPQACAQPAVEQPANWWGPNSDDLVWRDSDTCQITCS